MKSEDEDDRLEFLLSYCSEMKGLKDEPFLQARTEDGEILDKNCLLKDLGMDHPVSFNLNISCHGSF
jgi:hypothetical protein